MSSVSGSGGSSGAPREGDMVRRNREEYLEKEAELVKKHNKEIRNLAESHQAELDRINQSHAEQMNNFKNKTSESRTMRDRKYQEEMDKVRNMHRNQLQSTMAETERKIQLHREAVESDQKLAKEINDQKLNNLKNRYENQLNNQNDVYAENFNDMRNEQKATIERQREYITKARDKELNILQENNRHEQSDQKVSYDLLRQNADARLRSQELRHFSDKKRISDTAMAEINRERQASLEDKKYMREEFQEGIRSTRDRYNEAYRKERDGFNRANQDLKSTVDGRIDNQVTRLEREVADLKNKNMRSDMENKRKAQREIANAKTGYMNMVDNYKSQRDMALEQSNENNAKDIGKIRKETSKLLAETNKFHRQKDNLRSTKSKEALESMRSDFVAHREQQKLQHDQSLNRIKTETQAKEEKMAEYFATNLDLIKNSGEYEKDDLRTSLNQEKNESLELIKNQARKNQIVADQRLSVTTDKYEKRINDINDQRVKDKRYNEIQQKRLIKNMQDTHDSALQVQKVKYEERLQALNEQHSREIDSLSKRHNEQIDQLINTLKKA